jgi:hypothetical protein
MEMSFTAIIATAQQRRLKMARPPKLKFGDIVMTTAERTMANALLSASWRERQRRRSISDFPTGEESSYGSEVQGRRRL